IPQALIFGPMQSFFKTYSPGPNFSGDAQNNFAQSRPTINNSNGFQFRIDHRFRDADNMFFRFTQQVVTVSNPLGEQGSTGGSGNFGIRGPALRQNPNWSVAPGITWIKGNHNMKMGAWYIEAKRIQLNTFQTYTFANGQTGNPTSSSTGLSLASALLGFPNS